MSQSMEALTEKEKEVLRLIARGHDAKSMARHLGLSVHTINERLRFARRKMGVTSSREAARVLQGQEETHPQSFGPKPLGVGSPATAATGNEPAPHRHTALVIAGACLMSVILAGLLVLSAPSQPAGTAQPAAAAPAPDPVVVNAARSWLALVDAADWRASYRATGTQFRQLNTQALWASASQKVRVPLGAVRSRVLLDQQHLLAPPHGFESLRFQTDFAAKPNATETLTLEREGSGYRVVSYVIE